MAQSKAKDILCQEAAIPSFDHPFRTYVCVCVCSSLPKDLHRTGCSDFCGQDAADERAILKRVLLAYARWNKSVGYCQGFNILAAVILQVVHNNEEKALKVSRC